MGRVELTADAKEDLRDLDHSTRIQIFKALKKLQTEPEKRGQPLSSTPKGNLAGFRKLIVGDRDYRIIYRCAPDGSDVTVVWVIAKRADEEVYRLAVARLQIANELDEDLRAGLYGMLDGAFQKSSRGLAG